MVLHAVGGVWVGLTVLCGVVVDFNVRLLCIVSMTLAVCRAGKSYSEVGSLRVLLERLWYV
jgi:hypothetical protein